MAANKTSNQQQKRIRRLGVISDTHGYLGDQAVKSLAGVELIIHAGDIDTPDILDRLKKTAPVVAVRGNMDRGHWADELPLTERITLDRFVLFVLHDVDRLDLDPVTAGIHAVIYGHSHRPQVASKKGVLFINPGSASQPRHNHPPTIAIVSVHDGSVSVDHIDLTGS